MEKQFPVRFRIHSQSTNGSLCNLGMDRTENTSTNSSSIAASRDYRLDRVENTIPLLLFTAIT
jgi:hypothetical protein